MSQSIEPGFHALSEPIRLSVINLLQEEEELCVSEMCSRLDIQQSKLSFHLSVLKQADLIFARKEGQRIYYRCNDMAFKRLERYLEAFESIDVENIPS